MSVTVNTFPPLHAVSARSWFLAIIIGLHVAFFWVLSSGMMPKLPQVMTKPFELITTPDEPNEPPPPPPKDIQVDIRTAGLTAPVPLTAPTFDYDEPPMVAEPMTPTGPTPTTGDGPQVSTPVMTRPETDPRFALTEPYYPPTEIRLGHEGTVRLSVYVLANGRVGDVRLDQSSGYARLDESAMREARKWRFKPATQDGTPIAMWKQLPITFQLKN